MESTASVSQIPLQMTKTTIIHRVTATASKETCSSVCWPAGRPSPPTPTDARPAEDQDSEFH